MGEKGDTGGANDGNGIPPNKRFYKVAFSFASGVEKKERAFVKLVAEELYTKHRISKECIFFDEWAGLDGRGMADLLLKDIYHKCSEFIVPFFSLEYLNSYWTNDVEYEPIRIIKGRYPTALIPARFDDKMDIPGFPEETNFFINCSIQQENHVEVANKIAERLKEDPPRQLVNKEDCNYSSVDNSNVGGSDGCNKKIIFPFTNRQKELSLVLSSKIKDQLITAPVSYGKATFLTKLEEKFKEQGYITCLHTIDDQNQVADPDQLCKHLGYANARDFVNTILSPKNIRKIKLQGLVFLFVTKKMLAQNLKLLKVSIDQIRLQIKGKLEADNCDYTLPDIKIRLVVSSHQLYGDPRNEINWPYGFEALRLSEFTNQVIQDSLHENNFFNGKNYKEYGAIVAKLTLLTAGHPLLVKKVALYYKENSKFNLQTIKNDIIILTQGFSASIKNRTIKTLFNKKELTLYRYVNDLVLANLASKNPIKRKELTDSLLAHGIYEKATINGDETNIIRDSLLRRTCLLDYCYREPEEFLTKLKMAQRFYKEQFVNPQFRVEYTVLWLAEWLFSQLQEKLLSFVWDRSTYFKKIPEKTFSNNHFDNNEVSESIAHFANQFNDKKKLKEAKDCLLNRLKADWEFQLLLNYQPFQSDTQCYNTDAYNNLVSRIEIIFAPLQGAEHE